VAGWLPVSYLGFLAGPVCVGLRADDGTSPEDYEDARSTRLDFLSAAIVTYACEEPTGGWWGLDIASGQ
jgi:hypothetical protein